jgi:hypothetical protein
MADENAEVRDPSNTDAKVPALDPNSLLGRMMDAELRWRQSDRMTVEERAAVYQADMQTLFDAIHFQAQTIERLSVIKLEQDRIIASQRQAVSLSRAVVNAAVDGNRIIDLAERRARKPQ